MDDSLDKACRDVLKFVKDFQPVDPSEMYANFPDDEEDNLRAAIWILIDEGKLDVDWNRKLWIR